MKFPTQSRRNFMQLPAAFYLIREQIEQHFPTLRKAQAEGLALWTLGTTLAGSGCQNAVLQALRDAGNYETVRRRLKETLLSGKDKACPCKTEICVETCFPFLLRWVVQLFTTKTLYLACDMTSRGGDMAALVISVLYRNTAIPVAWVLLPENEKEAWNPHGCACWNGSKARFPKTGRPLFCATEDCGARLSMMLFALITGIRGQEFRTTSFFVLKD
jgi:hypothetical protein